MVLRERIELLNLAPVSLETKGSSRGRGSRVYQSCSLISRPLGGLTEWPPLQLVPSSRMERAAKPRIGY